MEDKNQSKKKLWTPSGSDAGGLTPDEKTAMEKEFIRQRQEQHVPEILPSEQEKIMVVLSRINQKYVGQAVTPQLKTKIEQEIKLAMESIGFLVKVMFNPLKQYQSPEVEITGRTSFDIDEAGKLIHEVKKRGGYKGDFNWRS